VYVLATSHFPGSYMYDTFRDCGLKLIAHRNDE